MKVFKILSTYRGKLTSVGTVYPHEITYSTDTVNRHPNMFVFESANAARKWITNPTLAELWECETSQARPAPSLILKAWDVKHFFEVYWNGAWEDWMVGLLKTPPEGTLLVDDLMLIKPLEL